MAGSIPPLRPGSICPVPASDSPLAIHAKPVAGKAASEAVGSIPNSPSIRDRLEALFGWKTQVTKETSFVGRFLQNGKSSITPPFTQSPSSSEFLDHGGSPHDKLAFGRAATPSSEPKKQLDIVKMLEKNDRGVNRARGADSRGARSWKLLAQTSISVEFERSVAELSKQRTQQLAALQAGIAQLPPDLSAQYQGLLSDIVAFRNPAERNTMLTDLARDVATRVRPHE